MWGGEFARSLGMEENLGRGRSPFSFSGFPEGHIGPGRV